MKRRPVELLLDPAHFGFVERFEVFLQPQVSGGFAALVLPIFAFGNDLLRHLGIVGHHVHFVSYAQVRTQPAQVVFRIVQQTFAAGDEVIRLPWCADMLARQRSTWKCILRRTTVLPSYPEIASRRRTGKRRPICHP